MATERDEVLEVARWAEGIEGIHGCIAGRFHRRNLADGCWSICRD